MVEINGRKWWRNNDGDREGCGGEALVDMGSGVVEKQWWRSKEGSSGEAMVEIEAGEWWRRNGGDRGTGVVEKQ